MNENLQQENDQIEVLKDSIIREKEDIQRRVIELEKDLNQAYLETEVSSIRYCVS